MIGQMKASSGRRFWRLAGCNIIEDAGAGIRQGGKAMQGEAKERKNRPFRARETHSWSSTREGKSDMHIRLAKAEFGLAA